MRRVFRKCLMQDLLMAVLDFAIRFLTFDFLILTFDFKKMSFESVYLASVIKRFREYKTLGDKTFDQLEENDFHFAPNASSNSIAVIIRHMHGNMMSRWTNFLTEDGEKEWRRRDEEFEEKPDDKTQLLRIWNEGWQVLLDTMNSLKEEDLLKNITIRSQPLSVTDAINRQLAHYGYHVGQLVYIGRWIRDADWKSLSIPKGNSDAYNQKMKSSRH